MTGLRKPWLGGASTSLERSWKNEAARAHEGRGVNEVNILWRHGGSLTDASAAGDLEDMDSSGVLVPSAESPAVPHPKDDSSW